MLLEHTELAMVEAEAVVTTKEIMAVITKEVWTADTTREIGADTMTGAVLGAEAVLAIAAVAADPAAL